MEIFEDEKNEDKRFLTEFSFICMLAFDVYIKKTMIEKLIDESVLRRHIDDKKDDEVKE